MKSNLLNIFARKIRRSFYATALAGACVLAHSGQAQTFLYIGNGTGSNGATTYPAPFGNYCWGAKNQMFITAAELTAAGLSAGSPVNSVGFEITNLNSSSPHDNFSIQIFTTAATNPLGTGYVTTGVVSNTLIGTVNGTIGWEDFQVPTFVWNGVDNLVIETCFYNNGWDNNFSTRWTNNLTGTEIKSRWVAEDGVTGCVFPGTGFTSQGTSATTRPNMRFEYIPPPCSGTPVTNTLVVPSFSICPNSSVMLTLANNYTNSGLTFDWRSSTQSSLGLWTPIATGSIFTQSTGTLTQSTWFSVVITCTNSGPTFSVEAVAQVAVAPITIDSVPYLESFEGITGDSELPNCSWMATNRPSITTTFSMTNTFNRVAHSGDAYAAFRYGTSGSGDYFYSNGIYMQAGITYSAGIWYITDGLSGWVELSLHFGDSQSASALTTIASRTGAVGGQFYQLLSDTFRVPADGIYYMAVKGIGNGNPEYMTWDDLFVTIPCQYNSKPLAVNPPMLAGCEGSVVGVSVTNADVYQWNNGSQQANLAYTLSTVGGPLQVVGTNTLSGCSVTAVIPVTVYPTPNVGIMPSKVDPCPGESINLVAFGDAINYTWNQDLTVGALKTVAPVNTSTYQVVGENSHGCKTIAAITITVLTAPNVLTNASPTMCAGETIVLTANGADNYEWRSNSGTIYDRQAHVSPNASTTYTLVGIGANGCKSDPMNVNLYVDACTGISEFGRADVRVFPNPNTGNFMVTAKGDVSGTISDLTGRLVGSFEGTGAVSVDINHLANGVYYIKIQTAQGSDVVRIVKE